jgi:hypothetical protein
MIETWVTKEELHQEAVGNGRPCSTPAAALSNSDSCWLLLCRRLLHLLSEERLLELVQQITDHYVFDTSEGNRLREDKKKAASSSPDEEVRCGMQKVW